MCLVISMQYLLWDWQLRAHLRSRCAYTVGPSAQDLAKRAWVDSLQDDVVYVSGRARKPGEMNGKSGNLNFCTAQLYPKARSRTSLCSAAWDRV